MPVPASGIDHESIISLFRCPWKLPSRTPVVTQSTLRAALNRYDCPIKTAPEGNEMMLKVLKFSTSVALVAFSLAAFGAVVFG